MTTRRIRLKQEEGRAFPLVEVVDVETGKKIENIHSINFLATAGKIPKLLIEESLPGFEAEVQAEIIRKQPDAESVQAYGGVWINGAWLARHIRKFGTQCSTGRAKAYEHLFTEELLKLWEHREPGPAPGQETPKEAKSHG